MIEEGTLSPLARWENFYVIVGSSAGALTGLQFVVITLIAEARAGGMLEIRAFGTPTVVHFCVSLLIAAIVSAPWPALSGAGIALGLCGTGGILYSVMIIRHARRQTGYHADKEDWFWYAILPLATYALLAITGLLLVWHTTLSLFLLAGTALLLLFIGIHNAWDTITYVAVSRRQPKQEKKEE